MNQQSYRVQIRYLTGNLAGLLITEITRVPREPGRIYTACITGDTYLVVSVNPLHVI